MTVPTVAAAGACAVTCAGYWAALRLWDGGRHPGPAFPLEISHEEYPAHVPGREAAPGTFPAGGFHRRALTWWRHTRYRARRIDGWAERVTAAAQLDARAGDLFPAVIAACRVTAFTMAVLATQPVPIYNDAAWDDYVKGAA